MFSDLKEVMEFVQRKKVRMVDLKFTDLFGRWHHVTIPRTGFGEEIFTEGVGFDASRTPGFKKLESGDMVLIPDPKTGFIDPFWDQPTLSFICNACEADTKAPYSRDPRHVAQRAEAYLHQSKVANRSLWGPEFEWYIFDNVSYRNDINLSSYVIDSEEADWNSGLREGTNLGHKIPPQGGYHAIPPLDVLYNVRTEMVRCIEECGIKVRYHHHEVGGPGQSEIEILMDTLTNAGDKAQLVKYMVKMVARQHNRTVTFMPKPLYNEAGSGMHFHQHLFQGKKALFYDVNGYAGLSKLALYYVGGLLAHGPALLAFTNPSTNSFKRLVPGFEAPTNLFFAAANRSAAIRVPQYAIKPHQKRIEFRPPDATCNPYLAMSAMLLAGLDGIQRRIDPQEAGFGPFEVDVFTMDPQELAKLKRLPTSLKEALDALSCDCQFLIQGGVFTEDLVETWIEQKMRESDDVRQRPHPYEISLYYDV
ncbi:MAG: glutamine synthetase [candidate division Zixibacteria bacterium SM23_81]|nr:MAG: glutamine synthetase [candidate division Zixibacteria bacterium SM23_81]